MSAGSPPRGALAIAVAAAVAVVLGSPYIGQLRGAVQEAFPGQYRLVVTAVVVIAVALALVAAVVAIRERRLLRYGCIAAALIAAGAYAASTRTGQVEQDLVEQFHFVQYGLLTFLFYRVVHPRQDLASLVLPGCAAAAVGVADEWVQWFVPTRVGEFHDVLIDAAAAASGTLFSVGIHPPARIALPPDRAARWLVAVGLTVLCLAVAGFVHSVHLGHLVAEPGTGRFHSTFTAAELAAAAVDRAARWRTAPPSTGAGLTREDRYLSEGLWHVQRRNQTREASPWIAWNENRILERYFAPVIDLHGRWPAAAPPPDPSPGVGGDLYVSDAEPYPILTLPAALWWLASGATVAGIWLVALRTGRSPAGVAPV